MRTDEVRECEITVSDYALYLVKLCQMCSVHGLIPEDAINAKQLRWPETVALVFTTASRSCVCGECFNVRIVLLSSAAGCELP